MVTKLKRPTTLKEGTLRQLRELITLGEFSPGERLIERVLCERLNVSRTVIRECIRHLESDQLVNYIPNVGPTVAVLNIEQIDEIYEAREILEILAVRSCAEKADEIIINKLENHYTIIKNNIHKGDIKKALRCIHLLYQDIFIAGNKKVAWELVERLNGRIGRLRALALKEKDFNFEGPENLIVIINAIKNNDADAAEHACRFHLLKSKETAKKQVNTLSTLNA